MAHLMGQNTEDLAKLMSQYQTKPVGGANFNGAPMGSHYINDQGSGIGK